MREPLGVLTFTDGMPRAQLDRYVSNVEELGYDGFWIPELMGREPFATAGFLVARTSRMKIATGIANIYARDAVAAAQARQTLAELSGGRFILGLGVAHPAIAELRGHAWTPPARKMREYLDAIARATVQSPGAAEPAPIVIAAHAPKLIALAAERADGVHTYLMPPEHTRRTRAALGPAKALRVVLPFVPATDPVRARQTIRQDLAFYMQFEAYPRMWRTLGFSEADFVDGGSDRLLDSIVGWGDPSRIRASIDRHLEAGATQVLLGVLGSPPDSDAAWEMLVALAPRTDRLAVGRGWRV
jgi:probable F420-dependent oxidoreductase